jgi:hypothetical protein
MRVRQVNERPLAAEASPVAKLDLHKVLDVKELVDRNAFPFLPEIIEGFGPNKIFRRWFAISHDAIASGFRQILFAPHDNATER